MERYRSALYIMAFSYDFLTILTCLAIIAQAQQTPTISYITQEQTRDIGGHVDLVCAVHDAQDYPVLWVKYNRLNETEPLLLSTSSSLVTKDPRFSLQFEAASGTSKLSIKNIQETDAGLYQCRVQMSVNNKVTADVELRVRDSPIFIDNSTRSLDTIAGETHAQQTPTISYINQEQTPVIGGQVDLICAVRDAQDYPVLWVKYDRTNETEPQPLSRSSSLIIKDPRFSLKFDAASGTSELTIKDIQETDAGLYQCRVQMSVSNKVTADVELRVRSPPIFIDNSTRSLVTIAGESVQMECYAGGFPPPEISWRRENNVILPTGGLIYRNNILKIPSVHKEDRGTYYCVAQNGVGKGVRRTFYMEVQFAPVVTIPRPRLQQALQYDMDLECHVEGYPPPTITWFKDEVQLMNNQHYRISKFRTSDEFTETTLRIVTIDQRHYGTFTCKAQNKLGTAAGQVELSEAIEPVCPPACGHHYLPAVLPLGELFMSLMSLKDSPIPDVNNTGLHQDPEINGSNKAPEIQES